MSKIIVLSTLFLSFATSAHALTLEQWKTLVIKVESFPCESEFPRYEGSGVILNANGTLSILTSDHVLIPQADENLCQEISNKTIGTVSVKITKYDYLKGLATLELSQKPSPQILALPQWDLKTSNAIDSEKEVLAMGVPAGSRSLQTLSRGHIVTTDSDRALIPGIASFYELSDLPVEYGMSGGVLLFENAPQDYSYGGMITHQFLKRAPGKATEVLSIDAGANLNSVDLSLAIPQFQISEWLATAATTDLNWSRKYSSKDNALFTSYGPLLFETKAIDSKYLKTPEDDGSGVGGDGSGIKPGSDQALQVTLDGQWIKDNKDSKLGPPVLNQWYEWLLRGEKLKVIAIAKPSSDFSNVDVQSIKSSEQFLTLWLRDDYTPIVAREDLNEIDSHISKSITLAENVRTNIDAFKVPEGKAKIWLDKLKAKTYFIDNLYLEPRLFKKEYDHKEAIWDDLNQIDFDATVELDKSIQTLVNEL